MSQYRYDKEKKLFLFFLLIILLFSFTSLLASAQTSEKKLEKQLKIFQLSDVLEKENGFVQQNAYFNNALAYFYNEHLGFAIKELDRIEYSNLYLPLYFKAQLLQAKCYKNLERWESALNIYQEIINKIPFMRDYIFYFLGKVYINIRDTRSALESFQHLIEEYPDSVLIAFARYQIALIYLGNNQMELFLQECRLAVETSLEEKFKSKVLIKMSDVLWEEELFIDSLAHLKELIENRYNREQISRYENFYVKRFQITKANKNIEIILE